MQICDIHTHITPGIDDGAENAEMTRAMLQQAYGEGVRRIVMTPHYNERIRMTADPTAGFSVVAALAKEIAPDLEVFPGNELYYSSSIVESLKEGRARTLAQSHFVLVEFSPGVEYDNLRKNLNELLLHGYQPIIAHVERYKCLYQHFVSEILNMGVLLQVNASSILSGGFSVKRFCKRLLKEDLVHFIASDCHNLTDRACQLGQCAQLVEKKYGSELAKQLFWSNPEKILLQKDIDEGA